MASAQIGSGLSDSRERYASLLANFCRSLLDFAEGEFKNLAAERTFHFPGRSLRIGCSSPAYAELCDRAYFAAAARENEAQPLATIAILDHVSLPDLPFWRAASPGMGNVAVALDPESGDDGRDHHHLETPRDAAARAHGVAHDDERRRECQERNRREGRRLRTLPKQAKTRRLLHHELIGAGAQSGE